MVTWTKVKRIALCAVWVITAAVGAWAQQKTPDAKKEYAKTVEITEPSAFSKVTDTRLVLKNDISVPRAGALNFTRCERIEIDLGGHTITYNTEDYDPDHKWGTGGFNVAWDSCVFFVISPFPGTMRCKRRERRDGYGIAEAVCQRRIGRRIPRIG